jgi:hypothetical protein
MNELQDFPFSETKKISKPLPNVSNGSLPKQISQPKDQSNYPNEPLYKVKPSLQTPMSRNSRQQNRSCATEYQTRIIDNIHIRPSPQTLHNAYQLLGLRPLTSKSREITFQGLNRAMWTKKAFNSRMRPDPNCERLGGGGGC